MPDTNPETTTENTGADDVSQLRKAAEGGKEAKAEAAALRTELAFTKAGIDTDSKPAKALMSSYEGELTAEAIQAEAKEWGLIQTSEPEPAAPDHAEAASLQEMRDAVSGNPAPDVQPEIGGVDAALKQFLTDRENGVPQQQAQNLAYGNVIKAAAKGDKQAVFDAEAFAREAEQQGHGAQYAGGNRGR